MSNYGVKLRFQTTFVVGQQNEQTEKEMDKIEWVNVGSRAIYLSIIFTECSVKSDDSVYTL